MIGASLGLAKTRYTGSMGLHTDYVIEAGGSRAPC